MSDSSDSRRSFAGFNQFSKLVRCGKAVKVYLAKDADPMFVRKVKNELSKAKGVSLDTHFNSAQLAEKAGTEVPTAIITETV